MKTIRYLIIGILSSIALSALIYLFSGGNILFFVGGIPLILGGFWTFGKSHKTTE